MHSSLTFFFFFLNPETAWICQVHPWSQTSPSYLCVSESARKVLQEDHGVMLFKLFEQPPLLLGRHPLARGNVMKKLFEALQGGSLTLVLVFLWSHLLAEGERCNKTWRGFHGFHGGCTVPRNKWGFLFCFVFIVDLEQQCFQIQLGTQKTEVQCIYT